MRTPDATPPTGFAFTIPMTDSLRCARAPRVDNEMPASPAMNSRRFMSISRSRSIPNLAYWRRLSMTFGPHWKWPVVDSESPQRLYHDAEGLQPQPARRPAGRGDAKARQRGLHCLLRACAGPGRDRHLPAAWYGTRPRAGERRPRYLQDGDERPVRVSGTAWCLGCAPAPAVTLSPSSRQGSDGLRSFARMTSSS